MLKQRLLCGFCIVSLILGCSLALAADSSKLSGFDMGDDFWLEANTKIKPPKEMSNIADLPGPSLPGVVESAYGPQPQATPIPQDTALPQVSLPDTDTYNIPKTAQPQTLDASITPNKVQDVEKVVEIVAPEVSLPTSGDMQKLEQNVKEATLPGPQLPEINAPSLQTVSLPVEPTQDSGNTSAAGQSNTEAKGAKKQSLEEKFLDLENRQFIPVSNKKNDTKSPAPQEIIIPEKNEKQVNDTSQPGPENVPPADNRPETGLPVETVTISKEEKGKDGVPHFAIPIPAEDEDEYMELDITPRQVYDYRNTILSPSISKKEYDPENQHLPRVFYHDEYSKLLFIASSKGDLGGVKALLLRGADINAQDEEKSYTPLMYAVANNKLQIARYLIVKGADLDIATFSGQNALHIACMYNRHEMIKLLIAAGLDPTQGDQKGIKPLSMLTENQDVVALQMLSNYKDMDSALLGCVSSSSFACTQHALSRGAKVDTKNKKGDTALIIAAKNNNIELVNLLLNYGADPRVINKQNYDAADIAKHNDNKVMSDIIETSKIKRDISGHSMEASHSLGDNVHGNLSPISIPSSSSKDNKPKSLFRKR